MMISIALSVKVTRGYVYIYIYALYFFVVSFAIFTVHVFCSGYVVSTAKSADGGFKLMMTGCLISVHHKKSKSSDDDHQ